MPSSSALDPNRDRVPEVIRLLFFVDVLLATLFALDNVFGHPFYTPSLLFDMDGEGNIPAWFSAAKLLALGALLGIFAVVGIGRLTFQSWPVFALSALCVAMSCDEIAQLHEWVGLKGDVLLEGGTRKGTQWGITGLWVFIVGPPFLLLVANSWRTFVRYLEGRTRARSLYLLGFFVYAASALGTEMWANTATGSVYTVQVLCEEFGELIGLTFLIWATLELLVQHNIRIRVEEPVVP